MNQHAKSTCCQGRIIKFGNRRRQCIVCRKTWRVHRKKVGRKVKREQSDFVMKYLDREVLPLYALAKVRNTSERQLQLRLRRSLDLFLKQTSWPVVPSDKPLIAIADAMVITLKHITYACYFILLREVNSTRAIVTEPCIKLGAESGQAWCEVFNRLSEGTRLNIVALVCDGQRGLVSLSRHNNWLLQRCNFHLLAAIQGRRSRWIRSRHRDLGQLLYKSADTILTSLDEIKIASSLAQLKVIAQDTNSPILRKILKGFLNSYPDFRTYLYYPELNLPRTSNSIESLISCVRELCHRARGFRTMEALTLWINALLKHKQTTVCNGSSPTKFRY